MQQRRTPPRGVPSKRLLGLLCAFSLPLSAAADSSDAVAADAVANMSQSTASGPANRHAAKALALLDRIDSNLKETRYQHRTKIRSREGIYYWDCSAMAAYILAKVAPLARTALTRERPVARDFYKVIRQAPTRGHESGWRRLRRITDVRAGDVFAWKRPKDFPSKSTGHVGFVLEAPTPAPGRPGAYLVRIVDATSLPHQNDTRDPEGEGGFGHGTILFDTDGDGHGIAYGWFGEHSRRLVETPIAFGRLIR